MQKRSILTFIFVFILLFSNSSCNELWGNHTLGNNLSLSEGDKKEDRIIVYCEGDCHGGIYVVPTYERHYDSSKQHYAEYVEEAVSNKKWVIAKTYQIQEKKENYWIISKDFNIENIDCSKVNCDSILQSHVTGPLNLVGLQTKMKGLNIDLDFK